jgi:hypothetical protein
VIELNVTYEAGLANVKVGRSGPHANRAAGTTIAAVTIAMAAARFGARLIAAYKFFITLSFLHSTYRFIEFF